MWDVGVLIQVEHLSHMAVFIARQMTVKKEERRSKQDAHHAVRIIGLS